MEYTESRGKHWVCFKPQVSKLSAANCGEFRSAFRSTIGDGEFDVILDLSQTRFMDSSAMGSVATSLKLLKPERHMYVCTTTETILTVLHLMRLDQILRIAETPAAAMERIAEERDPR